MRFELTPDQEFLRSTTARFLDEQVPVRVIRALRDDPQGFSPEYWRRGADLGWTSLLVDEAGGGGSVSGEGLIDLTLIAHEFGRHAAPGPLVATNVAAAALSDAGRHALLSDLLAGTSIGSWCHAEPGIDITLDGAEVVLNGTQRPVESAGAAAWLLVTGRTGSGLTQVVIPVDAEGVSVEPMQTVDLTRRYAAVTFRNVRVATDGVVGEVGGAADQVERQRQLALVISNAEAVGAVEAGFELTVSWAFDRYSFGRPLASYQALKHRFADMKSWLEASHGISDAAAAAVQARSGDAEELVSVASAYIGQYGIELLQDCVQLHGGLGVTFEHDLHLFLRRATLSRALLGTPADHRQRIASLLEQQEQVA